jgi:hypothetical protein
MMAILNQWKFHLEQLAAGLSDLERELHISVAIVQSAWIKSAYFDHCCAVKGHEIREKNIDFAWALVINTSPLIIGIDQSTAPTNSNVFTLFKLSNHRSYRIASKSG